MTGIDPAGLDPSIAAAPDVGGQAVAYHHGFAFVKAGDLDEAGIEIMDGWLIVADFLGNKNLFEEPVQICAGQAACLNLRRAVAGKEQTVFFTQNLHRFFRAGEKIMADGQVLLVSCLHGRRIAGNALLCEDGEPINDVVLEGPICREPTYRRTPLGREICDVMLAIPRAFRRGDYLPCILWGRTALEASRCHTRDILQIQGRLQSRIYTKITENGSEERTAYEISALTVQIQTTN